MATEHLGAAQTRNVSATEYQHTLQQDSLGKAVSQSFKKDAFFKNNFYFALCLLLSFGFHLQI